MKFVTILPFIIFPFIFTATISWIIFLLLVATLNDFNLLNPEYNIYYYFTILITLISLNISKN